MLQNTKVTKKKLIAQNYVIIEIMKFEIVIFRQYLT